MLCLGLSGCQQHGAHPTALDYFLAVLVVVTAVAAARLLACAVARCLFGDDGPAAAAPHHHHHHHDHDHSSSSSPSTSDYVGEDAGPWGAAGLPIFGPPGHGHSVPPPPPSAGAGWSWPPPPSGWSSRATSLTAAH